MLILVPWSLSELTTDEAARLLNALDAQATPQDDRGGPAAEAVAAPLPLPKYIYVKVVSTKGDNVNVKIPINLVRAGLKLSSFIPQPAMEQINKSMEDHGPSVDLPNFKADDLEELIQALREMEVNVDAANGDNVRVYAG